MKTALGEALRIGIFVAASAVAVGRGQAQDVDQTQGGDHAQDIDQARELERAQHFDMRRKVTTDEAKWLVVKGHKGATRDSLDYDLDMAAPFIAFDGLGPVSGSYGFFDVNPWTGAVWSVWDCRWLDSPALREAREKNSPAFYH